MRDQVSEELNKLEKQDVIKKIDSSEWVSPIVVSWKKAGKLRIHVHVCVDLRQVNEAIIPDKYPLPKIDEIFTELRNAKIFNLQSSIMYSKQPYTDALSALKDRVRSEP